VVRRGGGGLTLTDVLCLTPRAWGGLTQWHHLSSDAGRRARGLKDSSELSLSHSKDSKEALKNL